MTKHRGVPLGGSAAIDEGDGRVPLWLKVSYAGIGIWAVWYLFTRF